MGLVTLTFDLETGTQVASKVGNLPSKFGQARPLVSRIICYVRDGWIDRRTKATLIIAPSSRAGHNESIQKAQTPPRPKCQQKVIQDSNANFQINPDPDQDVHQIAPKML